MELKPRFRAPSRCEAGASYSPCNGTEFRKEGDRYVCLDCGTDYSPVQITPTELRPARCLSCAETFLWRWSLSLHGYEPSPPASCGACRHIFQALHYEKEAARHRTKAVATRASQRRAVARYKPPESLAEQKARSSKLGKLGKQ